MDKCLPKDTAQHTRRSESSGEYLGVFGHSGESFPYVRLPHGVFTKQFMRKKLMNLEVAAVPTLIYGAKVRMMAVEQGNVAVGAAGFGILQPIAGYTLNDQEYETRTAPNITSRNWHTQHRFQLLMFR